MSGFVTRGLFFALILSVVLPFAGTAQAGDPPPLTIPGSIKVDSEQLIDLVESMPELTLIDSRMASDRQHGYLEGSISLPDEQTTCETLAAAVPIPVAPVLFYCNGANCARSAAAVTMALGCHFTQVYWFRGGFEEWKHKGYPYVRN